VSASADGVKVTILDREYLIACSEEEKDDLIAAARYLDSKMRAVQGRGRMIGSERCAVMAALNISHELLTLRQGPGQEKVIETRLASLQEKVEAALEEARQISL
jgi:cell division protein ZapA